MSGHMSITHREFVLVVAQWMSLAFGWGLLAANLIIPGRHVVVSALTILALGGSCVAAYLRPRPKPSFTSCACGRCPWPRECDPVVRKGGEQDD